MAENTDPRDVIAAAARQARGFDEPSFKWETAHEGDKQYWRERYADPIIAALEARGMKIVTIVQVEPKPFVITEE